MRRKLKKAILVAILSVVISLFILTYLQSYLEFTKDIRWKVYDKFTEWEIEKVKPPKEINDILLVLIDNDTLYHMPFVPMRWPYPRSYFAKVINNLKAAHAKVIGIDFVFLGKSNAEEDSALKESLGNEGIVLGSSINERGELEFFTNPELAKGATTGVVTKITDYDGKVRRGMVYLTDADRSSRAFLSLCMQMLRKTKNINLRSFDSEESKVIFKNDRGEKWDVPVSANTKAFLIHYRAHTPDFPKLSFYHAMNGKFRPEKAAGKIVLIGLASSLFTDVHSTPLGWMPGVAVNANAFLTLYAHDFLTEAPWYLEWLAIILGTVIASFFASFFNTRIALLLIGVEMFLFFALSYLLFRKGLIWNYGLIPIVILISTLLGKILIKNSYSLYEYIDTRRRIKNTGLNK